MTPTAQDAERLAAGLASFEQAELAAHLTAHARATALTELVAAVAEHAPDATAVRLDWQGLTGDETGRGEVSHMQGLGFDAMLTAVQALNTTLDARVLGLVMAAATAEARPDDYDGALLCLTGPEPALRLGTVYHD